MNIINDIAGKLGGHHGSGGRVMVQVVEARNLARKDILCMFSHSFSYMELLTLL